MSAESTRRYYSAIASSSNKDNKDKDNNKDNKGNRRGRNKDKDNKDNKGNSNKKDHKKTEQWCDYHHRKVYHSSKDYIFNPKNKGKKPEARGPATASTSAINKSNNKADKPNTSAVRFDTNRYFIGATSAIISLDPIVESPPSVASAITDPDSNQDI